MEIPPPDPHKLLAHWLEWEDGDIAPGRLIANLKTAGLAELLQELASAADPPADATADGPGVSA
jgi:hypothetical protein